MPSSVKNLHCQIRPNYKQTLNKPLSITYKNSICLSEWSTINWLTLTTVLCPQMIKVIKVEQCSKHLNLKFTFTKNCQIHVITNVKPQISRSRQRLNSRIHVCFFFVSRIHVLKISHSRVHVNRWGAPFKLTSLKILTFDTIFCSHFPYFLTKFQVEKIEFKFYNTFLFRRAQFCRAN